MSQRPDVEPIPLVDLRPQYRALRQEIDEAIREVLESGQFILGPQVARLEAEVAAYLGGGAAVGVASGTDALRLALEACGVGAGDEVIVPSFTFVATASMVRQVGASPVFADITPDTLTLDPASVEARVNPRTRAVVPVHLFGAPADVDELGALCRHHGLHLIEDAAQAFGAEHRGRKVGVIGEAGCFSFFPSKTLGAYGDGGMLVGGPAVVDRARLVRNHGSRTRYQYEALGMNSRLDELQAAVLRVKLRRVEEAIEARRKRAALYGQLLADAPVRLPEETPETRHVFSVFTIRTPVRDRVRAALEAARIASAIYYPQPLHHAPIFGGAAESLPHTEQACREVLALPLYPELPDGAIERITAVVRRAC
ncbi:MAG: DegT/DnrJ/EryC1/StrS family aminotransferase [Deltaproteobacteria bacterium]|nr:DegT/DnrJ/EryC1/StrS family aminotransferase [Deltaproteobacteria bacterium]